MAGHVQVVRAPWTNDFPPVVLHTTVKIRDAHPAYAAAKSGDAEAAIALSRDLMTESALEYVQRLLENASRVVFLPVHAEEQTGHNLIPHGMARYLAHRLNFRLELDILQINKVTHTRADGFHRLAHQALFMGAVDPKAQYVLFDDHFGMGGTLANLRGYLLSAGASVIGATTLTASRGNAMLALSNATRSQLAERHGQELEDYLQAEFGFGVECLTEPEAGYLGRPPDVETIRSRIAAAKSSRG